MEDRGVLKRIVRKILLIVGILFLAGSPCMLIAKAQVEGGQWVLFHDRAINGSVVEAETGRPIEGALVVGLWSLQQLWGQGDGGYAKILLTKTDKAGKFRLPWWVTFKPWKFFTVTDPYVPTIIIYQPGFKLHSSSSISREGFSNDYTMTAEEKKKIKEKYSITPARLQRIYTDEERIENETDWATVAGFPNAGFSRKQCKEIYDALEQEMMSLNTERDRMLRGLRELRAYWTGGKR